MDVTVTAGIRKGDTVSDSDVMHCMTCQNSFIYGSETHACITADGEHTNACKPCMDDPENGLSIEE